MLRLGLAIATETGPTPIEVIKKTIGLYLEKANPASVTTMNRIVN